MRSCATLLRVALPWSDTEPPSVDNPIAPKQRANTAAHTGAIIDFTASRLTPSHIRPGDSTIAGRMSHHFWPLMAPPIIVWRKANFILNTHTPPLTTFIKISVLQQKPGLPSRHPSHPKKLILLSTRVLIMMPPVPGSPWPTPIVDQCTLPQATICSCTPVNSITIRSTSVGHPSGSASQIKFSCCILGSTGRLNIQRKTTSSLESCTGSRERNESLHTFNT